MTGNGGRLSGHRSNLKEVLCIDRILMEPQDLNGTSVLQRTFEEPFL